jgi:hypothetical protein
MSTSNFDGPIPNAYRDVEPYPAGDLTYLRAGSSGSPRPLAIARDVIIIIVGLIIIGAAVVLAVAANSAGNAIDQLTTTTSTSSSEPAPPICYVNPDDVSCPPGFNPNN